MREALITLLIALWLLAGCPDYLSDPGVGCWIKASTYHFFHANIFHLAANCVSIWYLFKVKKGRSDRRMLVELLLAFCIASLTYFISMRPVVGISNILFAVIGLRTPPLGHPWWRSPGTLIFFSITLLMLFLPQLAALTHIASWVLGAVLAALLRKIRGHGK